MAIHIDKKIFETLSDAQKVKLFKFLSKKFSPDVVAAAQEKVGYVAVNQSPQPSQGQAA